MTAKKWWAVSTVHLQLCLSTLLLGTDERNTVKQESSDRGQWGHSPERWRHSAECQHRAFFAEWFQNGLLSPFICTFSFEQNIYSSMGENGFLLRSASVCASPLWSSSHWMEDELRLGNAGTFMHMLTENFGSALRECMSKVFNISPGILHFMSEVLLKFTLLTLLKMFWADHSLW